MTSAADEKGPISEPPGLEVFSRGERTKGEDAL